jgi:maltose alpha-D-glucosyltransferase/alpha-amylase
MAGAMGSDPLWFKDAVIYHVLPASFNDSDGDGRGDFAGIVAKLDYVEALGVNAILVQPFLTSPPEDGDNDDPDAVRRLIAAAHSRGLRVILDLAIDSSGDQYPHSKAEFDAADRWVDMGADGFRLRGSRHLFGAGDADSGNHLETHAFLKQLHERVDSMNPAVALLAATDEWPEDTRPYFGNGDECHMSYNFPLVPRLFMALAKEDSSSIIEILDQTPAIPDECQWAMLLRNHDELSLETVTEEERDYLWRVYSTDPRGRSELGIRRRLAPLVENDRRRIELLNCLLLSMPGTPVLYYGDEIGMGDDLSLQGCDSVRTPMQWTAGQNAGFSTAPESAISLPVISDAAYNPYVVSVEAQEDNPNSLLQWTRHILALRQQHRVFGRGSLRFLHPENSRVLAYIREDPDETVLVVANLSRQVQAAHLDLTEFCSVQPVDLFSASALPEIGDSDYMLTLPAYGFYWLSLTPDRIEKGTPSIAIDGNLFDDERNMKALERALPHAIAHRRWFGAKSRSITALRVFDAISVPGVADARLLLAEITYNEGEADTYLLPVRLVDDAEDPSGALVEIRCSDGRSATVVDGCHDHATATALLAAVEAGAQLPGRAGTARGVHTEVFASARGTAALEPQVWRREGSNSSIAYGDRLMLKLFRRPEVGINPDWELGRFLTDTAHFDHVPATAGAIEYTDAEGRVRTLGLLQRLVPNDGDARQQFMAGLRRFFTDIAVSNLSPDDFAARRHEASLERAEAPALARRLFGDALDQAELLGRRTAEMHLAFARAGDPDLAPKPFTPDYQRSLYQATRQQLQHVLSLLQRRKHLLDDESEVNADHLLAIGPAVYERLDPVKDLRINALRIRVHGDYHLEQVLVQEGDYVILDFEGEPSASLSERRIKRSPLKDVAGMIRSFDYVARAALDEVPHVEAGRQSAACTYWTAWVGGAFLEGYLGAGGEALLPEGREASEALLRNFLLEKAAYEVVYELNNRPSWVDIPLRGILEQLR